MKKLNIPEHSNWSNAYWWLGNSPIKNYHNRENKHLIYQANKGIWEELSDSLRKINNHIVIGVKEEYEK